MSERQRATVVSAFIDEMPRFGDEPVDETFANLPAALQRFAATQPDALALVDDNGAWSWREFVDASDRIANALLARGIERSDRVAIVASNSRWYVAAMTGILAAGACIVPLPVTATAHTLGLMLRDSGAKVVFSDAAASELVDGEVDAERVLLAGAVPGWSALEDWLGDACAEDPGVEIDPTGAFNIIYSSGTTGIPKGIVHDHLFRSGVLKRYTAGPWAGRTITLLATPLYSNTTTAGLYPGLYGGGTVVLMAKFNTVRYLELAQTYGVTHTILVPVQYQRLLDEEGFDSYDLSTFVLKASSGAMLRKPIIEGLMSRWPGNVLVIYGMTEGGGGTMLDAAAHPDKWDTVGTPGEGQHVHVVGADGRVLPPGEIGEIVCRGPLMMRGYHHREDATQDMLWRDQDGQLYFRTGDLGMFDEDGFLHLRDRRKDMILSGGFNIYAEDLERVLAVHPDVIDVAVVGVPSEAWGETPLGFVVLRAGAPRDAEAIRVWANERLGKTQRLSAVELRDELPRNGAGKLLKRDLRAPYWEGVQIG